MNMSAIAPANRTNPSGHRISSQIVAAVPCVNALPNTIIANPVTARMPAVTARTNALAYFFAVGRSFSIP
jgi:hypothetical protein